MYIGSFPEVSLKEAREKRDSNRKLIHKGLNPALGKKREKLNQTLSANNTFELIAREWHNHMHNRWSDHHANDIMLRFEKDVFQHIGRLPISELKAPEVLATIRKIEERGALELASRALQNIGRVFRYAIATSRADVDPTYKLAEALKPQIKGHFSAIDPNDLPEFVTALRSNRPRLFFHTLMATDLLMLTFVRTSELIEATWDEFDFDNKIWSIPASRMKMKRDHLVPLSRQVIDRLHELKRVSAGRTFVFPHYSNPRRHMSNNTVLKAIERLGYKGRMTGHGFRALAMSTIKEKLGYRHEVIDRQLAHVPANKVDRAYDRAQFLDQRTQMMQDWADYIYQCALKGMQGGA